MADKNKVFNNTKIDELYWVLVSLMDKTRDQLLSLAEDQFLTS
jgi:hypothetical protein